jgi:RNA polymerase sigma-70 factor, ECF subfamily
VGHTLQPTALVNELYLELLRGVAVDWKDRAHFLGVAAKVLRRVLVEHARSRGAAKRGGGEAPGELREGMATAPAADEELLDLHWALEELEAMDQRAARVVELRYFGGLTEAETAEAMGVSLSTMKRDWEVARAWLGDRLRR